MSRYYYGMRMRPFGPGCQPAGAELVAGFDFKDHYWSIVAYDRALSSDEERAYELDRLGSVVCGE